MRVELDTYGSGPEPDVVVVRLDDGTEALAWCIPAEEQDAHRRSLMLAIHACVQEATASLEERLDAFERVRRVAAVRPARAIGPSGRPYWHRADRIGPRLLRHLHDSEAAAWESWLHDLDRALSRCTGDAS